MSNVKPEIIIYWRYDTLTEEQIKFSAWHFDIKRQPFTNSLKHQVMLALYVFIYVFFNKILRTSTTPILSLTLYAYCLIYIYIYLYKYIYIYIYYLYTYIHIHIYKRKIQVNRKYKKIQVNIGILLFVFDDHSFCSLNVLSNLWKTCIVLQRKWNTWSLLNCTILFIISLRLVSSHWLKSILHCSRECYLIVMTKRVYSGNSVKAMTNSTKRCVECCSVIFSFRHR